MIALLVACERVVVDLEATCAGVWPADDCAADCVDGPEEERWADTFLAGFAADAGRSEGDLRDRVRLRTMEAAADFRAVTSASWQMEVDWMRVVREVEVWVDGPVGSVPTDADLVASWRDRVAAPAFDPGIRLVPYVEVQAYVDACAERHGVAFDAAGWCDPYYGTDPQDDDPVGLRVDLYSTDGTITVSFRLDGSEASCEEVQVDYRAPRARGARRTASPRRRSRSPRSR